MSKAKVDIGLGFLPGIKNLRRLKGPSIPVKQSYTVLPI